MYRVTLFAHKQNNRVDMSFIRRLIYHGQTLLRTRFFGGPYRQIKISKELKIERNIHVEGESSTLGGNGRAGQFTCQGTGSNVIEWVGKEIHAQFRKVFVGNVLKRVSSNSSESIRKRAIQQLIYGNNSRPFFALVGLSLASGNGMLTKSDEFEGLCWEIKSSLSKKPLVSEDVELQSPASDSENEKLSAIIFQFGPFIGKGSEAVVYAADYKRESTTDSTEEIKDNETKKWPFAIKMMDNYWEASNALSIMLGFKKEIVPAKKIQLDLENILNDGFFGDFKKCPPHPNIIEIHSVFADQKILLPGMERYAMALPPRLNSDGQGRNMTLYLVMKNYDTNLERYLQEKTDLTMKTRVYLFVQLLEGLAHLFENSIAHRDLKADNLLLKYNSDNNYPHLVIGDFGCCLADEANGLSIPFRSNDTSRGGNPALMSPEIANAKPGSFKKLSYEKADLWSAGTIGYQIFGAENPFYMRGEKGERKYDSRTYEENALPQLPHDVPPILRRLVKNLLRKNPSQRVNADVSATICHLYLWGPTMWLRRDKEKPSNSEVMQWLLALTTKVLCQWNGPRIQAELEFELIRVFLNRLKFGIVRNALDWIYQEE